MLVVKDGREDGYRRGYHAALIEKILTEPPYYREDRLCPPGVDPEDIDEENAEPVRHLYNKPEKLHVGQKAKMVTKRSSPSSRKGLKPSG